MRCQLALLAVATILTLSALTCTSQCTPNNWRLESLLEVRASGVVDAIVYGEYLVIAFSNSTITCYNQEGHVKWRTVISEKGAPLLVREVEPQGLVVVTSEGWVGLLSPEGREVNWSRLRLDKTILRKGPVLTTYSSGILVIAVGRHAFIFELPSLIKAGPSENVINKFLKCTLNPDGSKVFMLGINTFCHICLEEDERLILIRSVKARDYAIRVKLSRVKDVGASRDMDRVSVAHWSRIVEYRIVSGKLIREWNRSLPIEAKEWKSWGFSPNGRLFHFIYSDGELLKVCVVDIDHRSVNSYSLIEGGPSLNVESLIDDDGRMLAVVLDPVSRSATLILLDISRRLRALTSIDEFVRVKFSKRGLLVIGSRKVELVRLVESRSESRLVHVIVRVVDDRGSPVVNATVALNSTLLPTSSEGMVEQLFEPGFYVISATAPHYKPVRLLRFLNSNTSITIVLKRLYTLRIKGVYDNGSTPPICSLKLYTDDHVLWSGMAVNCSLIYEVEGGNYTVEIMVGDDVVKRAYKVDDDCTLQLLLRGLFTANITVVDEDGRRVESAFVTLLSENGSKLLELEGAQHVVKLPRGVYEVVVSAPGYGEERVKFHIEDVRNLVVTLKKLEERKEPSEKKPEEPLPITSIAVALIATLIILILLAFYRFRVSRASSSSR